MFRASPDKTKPKYYALIEFPYPSGEGLHVGHPRSNTALDIISRKRRMEGYNVLYPIGYDAFGLPTENYAIKNKNPPESSDREEHRPVQGATEVTRVFLRLVPGGQPHDHFIPEIGHSGFS